MYEVTIPDPLETTVPDPVRRLSPGRRRAIEVCALVCVMSALLVTHWIDDSHLAQGFQQPERITVVPRGGTAMIGHSRWRLLGRDPKPPTDLSPPPPGSARLTLFVGVRPLDAQGVKDVTDVTYQVRDRQGHIWSATGEFPDEQKPAAGAVTVATVTANVPPSLVSSVVLEVRAGVPLGAPRKGPVQVLRFAH